eukprot:TRINITY_DN110858_c0_g1_i1.p1 TRINITY_DN110858_c0_g1~~TRINITY_DN110858_c0_g1_i1.p1  ORF type:complete len:181 (-),score=35.64 TRINITY_DN110858_c0_g1_i1:128-670(-)
MPTIGRPFAAFIAFVMACSTDVLAQSDAAKDMKVTFEAHEKALGIFWVGNAENLRNNVGKAALVDLERLVATVAPGQVVTQLASSLDMFAVRSADFQFRTKITVDPSPDGTSPDHPVRVAIKNLCHEGQAVELKHAEEGYQWISAGDEVAHSSATGHRFELRSDSEPVLSVWANLVNEEL